MKKLRKLLFVGLAALVFNIGNIFAQGPPPPNGDGSDPTDPGSGNNRVEQPGSGGGAPIGSGLALLIGFGLAYGTRKYVMFKTKEAK